MAAVRAGKVGIVAADDYIHGKQYERLDAVRYEGGVYLAKKHNVSEYPTVGENNEFWMFMVQDGSISGVKGNKEEDYRSGPLVNLTPENIGALPTEGGEIDGSLIIFDDLVIGDQSGDHVELDSDSVNANGKLYLNKNGKDIELGTQSSGVVVPSLEELRVIFSGVDRKLQSSGVTKQELDYLSGATSNIQRQLDSKASADNVGSEWESIARVNKYSRLAKLNGYASYLFTLYITQNSQVAIYTYLIGVSYNAVYAAQIASSGYTQNSNIIFRVVQGSVADEYYLEVLNTYLSSGSPDLPCKCRIIMLSNTPDAYFTMYNFYYAGDDSATVRASITSKTDGFVVSKIYGEIEGPVKGDIVGNVTGNVTGNLEGSAREWNGYKLVYLSESEYQNLTPKDSKTIYFRPKG